MADYRTIGWLDEAAAPDGMALRKLTPYDTLRLHRTQRAWLDAALAEPFDGSTVVVTHHGPHRGSLAPRFAADWVSTGYLSELPLHFFDVPVLWVHGHTHTSHDYQVGGCRVLCNPRGYQWPGQALPENEAFDADAAWYRSTRAGAGLTGLRRRRAAHPEACRTEVDAQLRDGAVRRLRAQCRPCAAGRQAPRAVVVLPGDWS